MNSGGRRIKRSVIVKTSTIKFLTDDDIQRLKNIEKAIQKIKNGRKNEMTLRRVDDQVRPKTDVGLRMYKDSLVAVSERKR